MKNKIFIEFLYGPRVLDIHVPIHICYLFISQFTKFEDLKWSVKEGRDRGDTGNEKKKGEKEK